MVDAIEMAEDAIGMTGMVMEDEGEKLPKASDYAMAYEKADKKCRMTVIGLTIQRAL